MFPKSLRGVRGSWGWNSGTGHCAVQTALVQPEVRFRTAGRVSLGPLGEEGRRQWGLGELVVLCPPQSVWAPLPRMASGGTEKPVPGRRSAWTGKWRPVGGGRGHGVSSVSAPCLLPASGNSPVFGAAPGLGLYIWAVSGLGLMTQRSYWTLVQVRMLGTEGLGVHGHTDRNDWQNENLNLGKCGQFYILCPSH